MLRTLLAAMALAAIVGWAVYEIAAPDERAPEDAAASGSPPDGPSADAAAGYAALATGEMAGFSLSDDRPALPDVELLAPGGDVVAFQAFEGQVLLVNFWAEWCAPCIHEMPALDRLQAKLGSDDFRVLPISAGGGDPAEEQAALEGFGASHLTTLVDPEMALMQKLGLTGLPVTLLVDRQGRIIGQYAGAAEWDSADAVALVEAAIAEGPGEGAA